MPTYDYRCSACKKTFEIFHSMTEKPRTTCPECGKKTLERQLGTGGAIIFKGSGFYQTDYRSEGYKKAAQAESSGSEKSTASSAKASNSAPATPKAESKPAAQSPAAPARAKPAKPKE
jgi:putative FmdB family regulatory protein